MGTIICRVEEGYVYGVFFLRVLKRSFKKSILKRLNKQAVLIDEKKTCVSFSFLQPCARTVVRFITFNTFSRHIFMLNTRSTRIGLGLPEFVQNMKRYQLFRLCWLQ